MRKLSLAGVAACAVAIGAQIATAQTGTCSIASTAPTPLSCAVTSTHSLTIPSLLSLNMSGFTGPDRHDPERADDDRGLHDEHDSDADHRSDVHGLGEPQLEGSDQRGDRERSPARTPSPRATSCGPT